MRARLTASLLIVLLGLLVPLVAEAQSTGLTLQQAISSGQANVRFSGTGRSSGDTIMAEVSRGPKAPSGPLTATVPPGSVLASSNAGAQNMMISGVRGRSTGGNRFVPSRTIEIPARGSAIYVLN